MSKDWAWGRDLGFADGVRAASEDVMKEAQAAFARGQADADRLRAIAIRLKERGDDLEAEARKTHGYEVKR